MKRFILWCESPLPDDTGGCEYAVVNMTRRSGLMLLTEMEEVRRETQEQGDLIGRILRNYLATFFKASRIGEGFYSLEDRRTGTSVRETMKPTARGVCSLGEEDLELPAEAQTSVECQHAIVTKTNVSWTAMPKAASFEVSTVPIRAADLLWVLEEETETSVAS